MTTSIEVRLGRLEMRQEALVSAIHGLTDVQAQTRDLVVELMKWLQEPPSSELPDLLKALIAAIHQQGEQLQTMTGILVKLPAQVARSVRTGEVG
jgi:ABC-type transporter Mla subunit MlaD